jgi:gluconolactonase
MECDELGNIWVTGVGGVWVIAPEGDRIGVLETPEICGSLCWGGHDLRQPGARL